MVTGEANNVTSLYGLSQPGNNAQAFQATYRAISPLSVA